jgi:hypothetical protein
MKLEPNPNRAASLPPLEKFHDTSSKDNSHKLWTGQRVNFGGRMMQRPPPQNRIVKEALYNTGATRIFDRHAGNGRPLNERPKKSGAGGHNWGWAGMEIGVELASKEELRDIEREYNPTAPAAGEEPLPEETFEGNEEWAGDGEIFGGEGEGGWLDGFSGWEGMIAGEERASRWPGYWEGLEGVRTLFGDELKSDEFTTNEPLPHATWEFDRYFEPEDLSKEKKDTTEESESTRRVALSVGGPPKYAQVVAWGNKEAERAAFEGVPVIPWGEEKREEFTTATRDIPRASRLPASRAQHKESSLPDEGPLGLEAELMSRGKKDETPANVLNKDIKTEVKIDAHIASKMGGHKTARELAKTKATEGDKKKFDIAESVSLPSS